MTRPKTILHRMQSARSIGPVLVVLAAAMSARPAMSGERYTQWFLDGEIDSLVANMAPQMQEKMRQRNMMTGFRTAVMESLGDSVTVGEDSTKSQGGVILHRRVLRGAVTGVEAEISWTLDSQERIAGFAVRPRGMKEAPSKYLDYQTKTPLRLPFEGEWTVFNGGRTLDRNHHAAVRNQRFALDLAVAKEGKTHGGDGAKIEEYYCWGLRLLAPAAGTVVAVENSLLDNSMGTTDREHPAGNHVILDHGNGEYSFLAHMQRGSVAVTPGDRVTAGQLLGLVGNSGNTSEPHLHYHLQDAPTFPDAEGMPAVFLDYFADGALVERGEPEKGQRIRAHETKQP